MRCAAAIRRATREIDAALALWRGDPTAGLRRSPRPWQPRPDGTQTPGGRTAAAHPAPAAYRRRQGRPTDRVGSRRLPLHGGDRACGFWPLASRCDELFDAALVDLHLSGSDCGAEGLAVVDVLKQRVVSARRPDELQAAGRCMSTRLSSGITCSVSSSRAVTPESGNFTGLRDLVADLLGDDVGSAPGPADRRGPSPLRAQGG